MYDQINPYCQSDIYIIYIHIYIYTYISIDIHTYIYRCHGSKLFNHIEHMLHYTTGVDHGYIIDMILLHMYGIL